MPAGSILDETADSYIVDDGSGNVAAVPKGAINPVAYGRAMPAAPSADSIPDAPAPPLPELTAQRPTLGAPAAPTTDGTLPLASPTPPVQQAAPVAPPKPVVMPTGPQLEQQGLLQGLGGLQGEAAAADTAGQIDSQQKLAEAKVIADRNAKEIEAQKVYDAQARVNQQRIDQGVQRATAAVNAADNYKIDPNRFYANMSTGKTVGVYVMAALAGLGDALQHKSGPNPVLQQLDAAIAQDAEQQVDERNRLGRVAEHAKDATQRLIDAGKSKLDQVNLLRARGLENAARQMELVAAQYGSPTALARAQAMRAQIDQKKGQLLTQTGTSLAQQEQQERAAKQQLQMHRESLGVQYANLKFDHEKFDYQKTKDAESLALEAARLDQSGNKAAAKAVAENGIGGIPTAKTDANGDVVDVDYKPMTFRDGSPFVAKTSDEAKALRKQKAGVDQANQIINDIVGGIEKYGGANKYTESAEWEQKKASMESLLFAMHQAYGVEGFKGSVLEAMEKGLGGGDPTSYVRSAGPGLRKAAELVNSKFTADLRSQGYDGPAYQPFSTAGKEKPAPTAEDQRAQFEGDAPGGSVPSWITNTGGAKYAIGERQKALVGGEASAYAAARSPDQRKQIENNLIALEASAKNDDVKKSAKAALAAIGPVKEVNKLAASYADARNDQEKKDIQVKLYERSKNGSPEEQQAATQALVNIGLAETPSGAPETVRTRSSSTR